MKIRLDGTLVEVQTADLDGDGKVDPNVAEKITPNLNNEMDISEPTELGESLKELNSDTIDNNSRMSGIDLRTRLSMFEIAPILATDALVAFKFLPVDCLSFTRQKKRLAVSLDGKGRSEIVEVIGGKREGDERKAGGMKQFFGLGGEK